MRNMMAPFKCLKFVKRFAATYSSHPLLIYAQKSFQITLFQKNPKNRFEDIELTADANYSMRNSLSKLEKEWNLQGWSTNISHSLGVFYFGLGFFKGCNTLLWKLTCYDLRVSQNFQDKPNLSGVFKKAFPQPPGLPFSRTDYW